MKFLYFLHSPGIGTNCAVLAAKTLHGPCNGNEGFHLDEPSSWVSCDFLSLFMEESCFSEWNNEISVIFIYNFWGRSGRRDRHFQLKSLSSNGETIAWNMYQIIALFGILDAAIVPNEPIALNQSNRLICSLLTSAAVTRCAMSIQMVGYESQKSMTHLTVTLIKHH